MSDRTPDTLESNMLGLVALAVCVLEILVIGGGCGIIYKMGLWGNAPQGLGDMFKFFYCLGFVALILSGLGLSKDTNKTYAGTALFLSIINLSVFGLIFSV